MSTVPNDPAAVPAPPGTDPYYPVGPVTRRHALGLPAGSVRAILSLLVVGLLCTLLLVSPEDRPIPIPAYLIYLLFLILGHFFAAHGNTIHRAGSGQPPPLYLPSGFIRFFIVGLLVGTVAWKGTQGGEGLERQIDASVKGITEQPLLPVILLGGFFLGILVHVLVGRRATSYWFEDFEAWVSLVAVVLLVVDALVILVINPSLKSKDPLTTYGLQAFVAALIAFYFGAEGRAPLRSRFFQEAISFLLTSRPPIPHNEHRGSAAARAAARDTPGRPARDGGGRGVRDDARELRFLSCFYQRGPQLLEPNTLAWNRKRCGNQHQPAAGCTTPRIPGLLMTLFWLLWVGLVLGGLAARLWEAADWLDKWLPRVRVPAPVRAVRPDPQRHGSPPTPRHVRGAYRPIPGGVTQAGRAPRPPAS